MSARTQAIKTWEQKEVEGLFCEGRGKRDSEKKKLNEECKGTFALLTEKRGGKVFQLRPSTASPFHRLRLRRHHLSRPLEIS